MKKNATIDLYCRRCRKSLHLTYETTGDKETPVLANIKMKCTCCTRMMTFRGYTEGILVQGSKDHKCYV